MTRRRLFACALVGAVLSMPSVARADDLGPLRARWQSGHDYASVLPELIAWHDAHGWSPEVDYMLGTAACRTPNMRDLGAEVLDGLARCDIGDEARRVVIGEHDACTHPSPSPFQVQWAMVLRASSSVSGKFWGMKYGDLANGRDAQTNVRLTVSTHPDAASAHPLLLPRTSPADPAKVRPRIAAAFPSWNGAPRFGSSNGFMVWASPTDAHANVGALAAQLDQFEAFLVSTYGAERPPYWINVFLCAEGAEAERAARSLHGVTLPSDFIAYDSRADWSILMLDTFGGGTAFHETTHLVVRTNFGNVPPWLDEGLASLYESAALEPSGWVGVPNYRQTLLESVDHRPTLRQLLETTWADLDRPDAADIPVRYALARSFALYLQDIHRLPDVVKKERESWRALQRKETDVDVVEGVLGKKMDATEADFQQWLAAVDVAAPQAAPADRDGRSSDGAPHAADGATVQPAPRRACGCTVVGSASPDTRTEQACAALALGVAGVFRRRRRTGRGTRGRRAATR